MKIANTRFKKITILVIGSVLLAVIVIIILISPITKYIIEKYDEKYTGRQIELGWAYVNPFTGYIHLSNLVIYESKTLPAVSSGDSIFFSSKGVSANFALLKLLSKTIEITEITLDQPKGIVIQNEKLLNFTDVIKFYTPKKPSTAPASIHFSILGIHIINGEFHYREKRIPINYYIKNVNIESSGKRWNSDTIAARFSLLPGTGGGDAKGDFTINFKNQDYRYAVTAHKFDLNIIQQYLKDLTNNGIFSANLDAEVKAKGNFRDQENLTMSGQLAINDFHFGKNTKDDMASFTKLVLAITEISPENHIYLFDSVSLSHPFLKFERYDYLDNVQMMFGKNGVNITAATSDPAKFNLVVEIARYVKVLAKNFFQSEYKINRLAIYNGDLKFNDYAISEKFSVDLFPLYITADSIDKDHKQVDAYLKTGIKPYGNISVVLRMNPRDSMDFDIQYALQKLPVAMFNPYIITYTSYPLNRGTIELNGCWRVRNGIIQSNNHILILDPRRTKRVRNKDKKWLPLPLIMSLVRERGNVIDYQIPITGNLKDPKFHLHDVLVDLIENIFVKPATTAYRVEVKNIESEIEQSLTLTWGLRTSTLMRDQERFVNKMADYLADNLEASIGVFPVQYAEKEKEYILFFEAKKKYFLLINHKNARSFSEGDSESVDKMSVKDSLFMRYLARFVRDTTLYTIQEKCSSFVGKALIDDSFKRLGEERKAAFLSPFKKKSVQTRVNVHTGGNDIPYNGFSFYKIDYKGDLPAALIRAHRRMNDLNNEAPREKYRKERKKNSNNRVILQNM
ncbi:MAG: DUF748 domain-containing protein [Bacteroidetes bacterium]|nr:DUF748 domain-containing protein [Bacteroidota bacterium]